MVDAGHATLLPDDDQLERSSAAALHEQLSDRLRDFARTAEVGTRLPSEERLVRRYGVSRVTVRRAIETLVEEGLLVRRQGMGTFVGPQRIQSLDRLRPFVDVLKDEPGVEARLIEFGWASSAALPEQFGGPEGEVLTFRRLYVSHGVPDALVRVSVPKSIGQLIERKHLESTPIYHVLQNDLGIALRDARVEVTSESADADVVNLLHLSGHAHLLVLRRITSDASGMPVEFSTHFLRPEVYRLRVSVAGGALPQVIRLPGTAGMDTQ